MLLKEYVVIDMKCHEVSYLYDVYASQCLRVMMSIYYGGCGVHLSVITVFDSDL